MSHRKRTTIQSYHISQSISNWSRSRPCGTLMWCCSWHSAHFLHTLSLSVFTYRSQRSAYLSHGSFFFFSRNSSEVHVFYESRWPHRQIEKQFMNLQTMTLTLSLYHKSLFCWFSPVSGALVSSHRKMIKSVVNYLFWITFYLPASMQRALVGPPYLGGAKVWGNISALVL